MVLNGKILYDNQCDIMIKDKITPEIKSRFLAAIEKTKQTGKEHGFFLCLDNSGNISPSRTKSGEMHELDLGSPIIGCPGKKMQGDFHTHSYFTTTKTMSKLVKPGTSDDDIRKLINNEFNKYKKDLGIKELSINSPSEKDLLKTILHNCAGISKTTCVASDMGDDKVECWTAKKTTPDICTMTYNMLFEDEKERITVMYDKRVIPLFDKETIHLK